MTVLDNIAEQVQQSSQPPVHLWKPANEGVIDIVIDDQGHWFHEGQPFKRQRLVRLFSSILWHESAQFFLVTPVEKLRITVHDVPFLVHQAKYQDGVWRVITNTHDEVTIDQDHPVELRRYQEQWVPYVRVRYDLWARVNRSIYYQWVEQAMETHVDGQILELSSAGNYRFEVAR